MILHKTASSTRLVATKMVATEMYIISTTKYFLHSLLKVKLIYEYYHFISKKYCNFLYTI